MPQQQSPWLETAYGWTYGENGWNVGMDTNLLKFSVMFDRNVDSIVGSLPPAVNGQVHYNTTDNRLYFAVNTTYFSTPVPKWFTIVVRSTGVTWQFNGSTLSQVDSIVSLDARLDAVELTLSSLGTAAFEDISAFATQAELDVVEGQSQAYTDTLRTDLAAATDDTKGTGIIGYAGYTSLLSKLQAGARDFREFKIDALSDLDAFQEAITAGSVIVKSGESLSITGDITIPANRLIIVERGSLIVSSGRFTAYGVNNVHWLIDGEVRSEGMTAAAAKSGWPNTGEGTQNGNERGFIEFGGTVFAGDDGSDYSVIGSGIVSGDWVGVPNVSDIPTIVNRKGIAAWNCSRFYVSIRECYGFEGEAVYWFSRGTTGSDVVFDGIYSHDHRFNALNINALAANEAIVVRDCITKNSYTGCESSAGDVINNVFYTPEKFGLYFGQGSGGGDRLVQGNRTVGAKDTAYSLLYLEGFESQPTLENISVIDNIAIRSGVNSFAVKDFNSLTFKGNSSYEHGTLSTGYAFGFFGVIGGTVSDNVNINPGTFGTEHIRSTNCALSYSNNQKTNSLDAPAPQIIATDGFTGGVEDPTVAPGSRRNSTRILNPSFSAGSGSEVVFCTNDVSSAWRGAAVGHSLESVSGSGVKATMQLSTRRAAEGDPLLVSLAIDSAGNVTPGSDAAQDLGHPSFRFNNSYFAVAPTVTSDRNSKSQIRDLSDSELAVGRKLKHLLRAYVLKDGLTHFGAIAQEVEDAFLVAGLDPSEYGVISKSDEGVYGLRYEELVCLILASL